MKHVTRVNQALSSTYRNWVFRDSDSCPNTLVELFLSELPHIPKNSWKQRFEFGGAYVNGKAAREDQSLVAPCWVEYYESKFPIEQAHNFYPAFREEFIIYRDQYIMVVFKPRGLPSLPAKDQFKYNLRAYLNSLLGSSVHMPSRIDTSTSGLLLVSIHPDAHKPLQQSFEKREVKKEYLLQVEGHVAWQQKSLEARIDKDCAHQILRKVVDSGGKTALTDFRLLEHTKHRTKEGHQVNSSILKAYPLTGRTHQIRVHSAHLGHPIIGDNFYQGLVDDSLHLLSYGVGFRHPIGGEEMQIELPQKFVPLWLEGLL